MGMIIRKSSTSLIAQVPSYISRSVAGSYDNEAVAIFALIFTFYLYIKVIVMLQCCITIFIKTDKFPSHT